MADAPEKRLYVVFSTDAEVQSAAEESFDDTFRLEENTLLARTEMVADDVATKIGLISEEDPKNGVVLKANHTYTGYFDGRLWDWLD